VTGTARASVLVVGDALVEVTVAPTEPMRPGGDARASISIGAGGQGANVAVRVARRGIDARLVAAVGDDAAGRLVRAWLDADGVRLVTVAAERTGAVLVTLDASGERSMVSDRMALESLASEAFLRSAAAHVGWVHLSGYTLRGVGSEAFVRALRATMAPGARLSVAGGSLPRDARPEAERFRVTLAAASPDLLVLARDEAVALLDADEEPAGLVERLAGRAAVVIVTAGASGAAIGTPSGAMAVDGASDPRPIIDATGAGDAYVGSLIARLAGHATWPPDGQTLRAAAEEAAEAGAAAARVRGAQGRIDGEAG
jgi:sugar/nucleoside kinase (ribokinase family)